MDGPTNLDHLPDDPALLKGLVRELLVAIQDERRRNEQLTHRLDLLLKRVYGPRADKLDPSQLSLFDEPASESTTALPPLPEPDTITTNTKKNGHGRGKLPDSLRRETEIIDVPESVKQATGGTWVPIGEEISEKLDYTPSSLFVRRIVRPKYVVRFPDSDRPDELKIADLPSEALPKSKAAPGLVADVIVSKLVDHLPLYRQEQRYARQGLPATIRKATYTTNTIESVNSVIRKFTCNRKQYPNRESALKLIDMAIHEASKKWTMLIPQWKETLNNFAILFENRMPKNAQLTNDNFSRS